MVPVVPVVAVVAVVPVVAVVAVVPVVAVVIGAFNKITDKTSEFELHPLSSTFTE